MRKLQKVFAFFLLLVFLFPTVEKEIHAYAHQNDFHCDSKAFHFHEQEHHCNLCDFSNHIAGFSNFSHQQFIVNEVAVFYFSTDVNKPLLKQHYFFSLRGPPSLV